MTIPLLDLHDLGLRQTGNESWARSIGAALLAREGPGYDVAVTRAAAAEDLARLPARTTVCVSTSSVRRLMLDLPRIMRRLGSSAVLVQYTVPASRIPAVVAVHDLSFEDSQASEWLGAAQRLRYRATIRASVKRAAHVLALSRSTKDDLVHHYGLDPAHVTVAPAAVDPLFATRLVQPRRPGAGPATVLTVGNVVRRKNLVVVARAVRALRDRGADVRMRVVGNVPPDGRAVAAEISAVLGDHVQITGYVSGDNLAQAYLTADVLAFPSLYEGFGIPIVEAMTAGLPVAVSDRTSMPEVVADAGLIVPAGDVCAWTEAIAAVLEPRRAADLAGRGRVRAATYTWERSAAVVSEVLSRVAVEHAD